MIEDIAQDAIEISSEDLSSTSSEGKQITPEIKNKVKKTKPKINETIVLEVDLEKSYIVNVPKLLSEYQKQHEVLESSDTESECEVEDESEADEEVEESETSIDTENDQFFNKILQKAESYDAEDIGDYDYSDDFIDDSELILPTKKKETKAKKVVVVLNDQGNILTEEEEQEFDEKQFFVYHGPLPNKKDEDASIKAAIDELPKKKKQSAPRRTIKKDTNQNKETKSDATVTSTKKSSSQLKELKSTSIIDPLKKHKESKGSSYSSTIKKTSHSKQQKDGPLAATVKKESSEGNVIQQPSNLSDKMNDTIKRTQVKSRISSSKDGHTVKRPKVSRIVSDSLSAENIQPIEKLSTSKDPNVIKKPKVNRIVSESLSAETNRPIEKASSSKKVSKKAMEHKPVMNRKGAEYLSFNSREFNTLMYIDETTSPHEVINRDTLKKQISRPKITTSNMNRPFNTHTSQQSRLNMIHHEPITKHNRDTFAKLKNNETFRQPKDINILNPINEDKYIKNKHNDKLDNLNSNRSFLD
ncbi:hypothetical protein K502DRAFT_339975 [Neoconidiobolus thromboides FSU 785]|nr:hypothetical protein K502DRAFT_339975 [Neoconidiobolus thromboides FSU 785]